MRPTDVPARHTDCMRKRLVALLVAFGFGVAALVGWLCTASRDAPPTLSVVFLGYTNASGTNLALFKISNPCPFRVKRWDIYQIEAQPPNAHVAADSPSAANILRPGQSETVALIVPPHNGSWRAVFVCSRASLNTKLKELVALLKAVVTAIVQGSGSATIDRVIGGSSNSFSYSNWIDS